MLNDGHPKAETEEYIVVDCPICHDPLLLYGIWPEILHSGRSVPPCPECAPEDWADDVRVKITDIY